MNEIEKEKPINEATLKEVLFVIVKEEAQRIGFGKVFIEITVNDKKITNLQAETKRSQNVRMMEWGRD